MTRSLKSDVALSRVLISGCQEVASTHGYLRESLLRLGFEQRQLSHGHGGDQKSPFFCMTEMLLRFPCFSELVDPRPHVICNFVFHRIHIQHLLPVTQHLLVTNPADPMNPDGQDIFSHTQEPIICLLDLGHLWTLYCTCSSCSFLTILFFSATVLDIGFI